MQSIIEFDGIIEQIPGAPQSGAIMFPHDLMQTFGKKSVKVKITYDGIPYRGLLKSMGGDCVYCLIRKEIRQQLGKQPGDSVHVTVQEDTEERIVIPPDDLRSMLEAHPVAGDFFDKLSYTCKKEYVEWITSAKRQETRQNRLQKAVQMLSEGKKEPR